MIFSGDTILQSDGSDFPFSYLFLHVSYNSAALMHVSKRKFDYFDNRLSISTASLVLVNAL